MRYATLPVTLAAVLLVVGCGGGGSSGTGDSTRTGDRGRQSNQDLSPDGERGALRLGVVGDSYANGEGVGAQSAWPNQLVARLAAEDGPKVQIVANPSVTGWTTQQALDSEIPKVRAARPDAAAVSLGVNDWVQGVPADVFRQRFARVLDETIAIVRGPGRVVVVTIPDFSVTAAGAQFGGGRDITAGIKEFNAIVAEESRRAGVAVADVFGLSQAMSDPALTAPDGLHPSARELGLWADKITPVARRAWRYAER